MSIWTANVDSLWSQLAKESMSPALQTNLHTRDIIRINSEKHCSLWRLEFALWTFEQLNRPVAEKASTAVTAPAAADALMDGNLWVCTWNELAEFSHYCWIKWNFSGQRGAWPSILEEELCWQLRLEPGWNQGWYFLDWYAKDFPASVLGEDTLRILLQACWKICWEFYCQRIRKRYAKDFTTSALVRIYAKDFTTSAFGEDVWRVLLPAG